MTTFIIGLLCVNHAKETLYFSSPYMVINAEKEEEACDIYNDKIRAKFYHGKVMGKIVDDKIIVTSDYCNHSDCTNAIQYSQKSTIKK